MRLWSILWVTALLCSAGASSADRHRRMAVIVHPKNPVSNLSLSELRELFLKVRARWSDGKPVLPINHSPRSELRKRFDRMVLRMSPEEAASFWIRQRVRGLGHPPRSFRSTRLILRLVSKQREAVAYLPWSEIQYSREIKVLRIEGRLPAHPNYALLERVAR